MNNAHLIRISIAIILGAVLSVALFAGLFVLRLVQVI